MSSANSAGSAALALTMSAALSSTMASATCRSKTSCRHWKTPAVGDTDRRPGLSRLGSAHVDLSAHPPDNGATLRGGLGMRGSVLGFVSGCRPGAMQRPGFAFSCAVLVSLLCSSGALHAGDMDSHLTATYLLARKAGFTHEQAKTIAT
ncbi:MAG: hypothetical protein ABI728_12760, partial [Betaproteobacteria bacterium]